MLSQPTHNSLYHHHRRRRRHHHHHHHPLFITFMQGVYRRIPETNHVSGVYSAAAILRVLLMVYISLFAVLNCFVLLH
jgi:hypothetical protein